MITTCSTETNLEESKDYKPDSKINSKIARIRFVFSEVLFDMFKDGVSGSWGVELMVVVWLLLKLYCMHSTVVIAKI
ncbi:hypothetical protein Tco_0128750 [Tanacetum coccineum]